MKGKTKEKLIEEIELLRREVAELKQEEAERKRAEEALQESEEFSSSLVNNSPNPILVINSDTSVRHVNSALEELTGFTSAELVGRRAPYPWWTEETLHKTRRDFEEVMRQGVRRVEELFQKKSGERFWAKMTSAPVISNGESKYYLSNWVDITERKKAEEAVQESEEKLKTLVESVHDVIFQLSPLGFIQYVSPNVKELYGYEPDDLIGKHLKKTTPVSEVPKALEALKTVLSGKVIENLEINQLDSKGKIIPTEINVTPVKREGEIIAVQGVMRNITERKKAEEALRASESEKKSILDAISDIVIFQDKFLSIRWVNEAAARSVGKTPRELVGCHCYEVWQERSEPCEGCPVLRTLETGSYAKGIMTAPDGRWWEITGEPVCDSAGEIMGAIEIAHDITERKRVEEELKASLKGKELLLKEIHHRVKNNLQVISSLLRLQGRYMEDKRALEMLSESQNRVRSMALIHEALYRSGDLARIDLDKYVRTLADDLYRTYGAGPGRIALKTEVGDIWLGIDVAIPCGLIINELVSNSLKYAFPRGGQGKGEVKISLRLTTAKDEIELIVSDNGVGIPKDLDFKKTKTLGLQLVTILVEDQLKGEIQLDRKKGTKFQIKFREVK